MIIKVSCIDIVIQFPYILFLETSASSGLTKTFLSLRNHKQFINIVLCDKGYLKNQNIKYIFIGDGNIKITLSSDGVHLLPLFFQKIVPPIL